MVIFKEKEENCILICIAAIGFVASHADEECSDNYVPESRHLSS